MAINNVQYLYESTLSLVQQAFDLVEIVWASVKFAWQQLSDWLGFFFDWSDILRTQQAIVYAVPQLIGSSPGL